MRISRLTLRMLAIAAVVVLANAGWILFPLAHRTFTGFASGPTWTDRVYRHFGCWTALLTLLGCLWVFLEIRHVLPAFLGRPLRSDEDLSGADLAGIAVSALLCASCLCAYAAVVLF